MHTPKWYFGFVYTYTIFGKWQIFRNLQTDTIEGHECLDKNITRAWVDILQI